MSWAISIDAAALLQGMDDSPSGKLIHAEVPLSEMFGYATDLTFDDSRPCNLLDGICQNIAKSQRILLNKLLIKVQNNFTRFYKRGI